MNEYHLYEELGRGKHSVVYKVRRRHGSSLFARHLTRASRAQGRKKRTIQFVAIKGVDKCQKDQILHEVICQPTRLVFGSAAKAALRTLQVKIMYGMDHPNVLKFHAW